MSISSLPERIGDALAVPVTELRPVGGQHGYRHVTGTLADGRSFFAKVAPGPAGAPGPTGGPGGAPSPGAAAGWGNAASRGGAPRSGDASGSEDAPGLGGAPAAAFAAEANGLRWLAQADGGPPVPRVLGVSEEFLVIELIEPLEGPSPEAARRLGADLARMHAAGAARFGAPWPGCIASLPLDNTPPGNTPLDNTPPDNMPLDSTPLDNTASDNTASDNTASDNTASDNTASDGMARTGPGNAGPKGIAGTDWGTWYAERRVVPYLKRAHDDGSLSNADVRLVETVTSRIGALAGPPELPSRIHGDLWSGNVLWSNRRAWLIDPAAHGGHRETDLAMLALFGAPHLAQLLQGYTETSPLPAGWRSRVPLHQLHPLLVHVCLFGAGYTSQLRGAARAALRN